MASVVDTSVKHFHSGMVGAPILNGVVGSLIALLNACLKDGFDTKAATSLVVAGGVATLNFSGTHSATVDSVVLVAGSSVAALNGEQKVTAIGSGFVKFATAAADGTASGTITFKMAPAGWLQPFVSTNLATYKSADPAGTGMILRVDDTATMVARLVGYEQMTDVNTGLGAFPTAAQMSGGGYWHKSTIASAAPTQWVLIADGRKFIFHNASNYPSNATFIAGYTRGFGDDLPMRPGGDPYACSLSYSITASTNSFDGVLDFNSVLQHAMPRSYTGLGSCVMHALIPYVGGTNMSGMDSFFGVFPSAIDGGLRLGKKVFLTATSGQPPRSELPALHHVAMSSAIDTFKTRDIIMGTGALAAKRLMALNPSTNIGSAPTSSGAGVSFVDITGPWR